MAALDQSWRDVRYAARSLRRTPAFTAVAVLSLALGLALVAAIVAAVNAYLIRSLPYPGGERLYNILYARPGQREPPGVSLVDWDSLGDVAELAVGSDPDVFYLTDAGYTEPTSGSWVGPGFVEALGIRPALGRVFTDADFAVTAPHVALVSHSLWRDRFASDPNIAGRNFQAYSADQGGGTESFTIVGVLPAGFWHVSPYTDVLVPVRSRLRPYLLRLRAGVPVTEAARRISSAIVDAAPSAPPGWSVRLQSVHQQYVQQVRPILLAITAAAGIVLVIICANVAFLVLLRATRRQKEVAVRLALGARRRDVVRMLMTEACLICLAALTLGIGFTWALLRLLAPLIEERLGRAAPGGAAAIAIDPTVLAMVGALGLVIAAALSLTPLVASSQRGLADPLRREGRSGTESRSSRRARSALIAFELAGSLALLVGCGLMIRTVVRMVSTDLGFTTRDRVRAHLALPAGSYPDPALLAGFYDRLLDDLAQAPDHEPAAVANFPPFFDPTRRRVEVETGGLSGLDASVIGVSGEYFALLDIPLVDGRPFTRNDRLGTEPVVIISETLARRISPDGHVLGRRVRTIEEQSSSAPLGTWRTIVGVARDVRQTFTDENTRDAYLPVLQIPNRFASVYLATRSPAWMTHLRSVVSRINPEVSLGVDPPLDVAAAQLLAGPRFLASLLTGFALFAALLAVLGVYGVMAYAVEQREREIAIRIALGASARSVIALFLKQGAVVLAVGTALGLMGARAVGQVLQTQLYGVPVLDVPTYVASGLLLASAGLLAIWWPARRAAHREPMHALKEE